LGKHSTGQAGLTRLRYSFGEASRIIWIIIFFQFPDETGKIQSASGGHN
jgi:hypothetical protein